MMYWGSGFTSLGFAAGCWNTFLFFCGFCQHRPKLSLLLVWKHKNFKVSQARTKKGATKSESPMLKIQKSTKMWKMIILRKKHYFRPVEPLKITWAPEIITLKSQIDHINHKNIISITKITVHINHIFNAVKSANTRSQHEQNNSEYF